MIQIVSISRAKSSSNSTCSSQISPSSSSRPPSVSVIDGRLLVDLLEHEVLEAALLGLIRIPVDVHRITIDEFAGDRLDRRRRPR